MEIKTLLCKRDVATGIACLRSLQKASVEPITLIIHEDGSLDEADIARIMEGLPGSVLRRRREEAGRVEEILARYPNCRAFRERSPLSNKLLDIPILSEDILQFIDSDIMFFKRFDNMFPAEKFPIFSQEAADDQGYSAPLLTLIRQAGRPVPSGCNSGLFRFYKADYDLDYLEWFLGREELCQPIASMVEQTGWALLFGVKGSFTYEEQQLACIKDYVRLDEKTIAVHFLYGLKSQMLDFEARAKELIEKSEVHSFRFTPAKKLTFAKIVKRKIRR